MFLTLAGLLYTIQTTTIPTKYFCRKMGDGPDMEAGVRSLIEINGLGYRMTPGMSVATSRVTREWNAIRQNYTQGDVLSVPISSGAAYVDPDNSYLTFFIDLQLIGGGSGNLQFYWGSDMAGRQNCLNLFRDMRLTHSSGYEVDRITKGFGPWKYIQNAYTKDEDWHRTVGSLLRGVQITQPGTTQFGNDGSGGAYGRAFPAQAPEPADDATQAQDITNYFYRSVTSAAVGIGAHVWQDVNKKPFYGGTDGGLVTIRCCIPLSCISGIWDNDQLSPSFLMAGARLDLTLQDKTQVWQVRSVTGAAPTSAQYSYTLRDPKLVLETITFTDAILRAISMTSANSGLEIPFNAMHYASAPVNTSSMTIQVNRGLSRANMIIIRLYPNTSVDNSNRCAQLDSNAAYQVTPDTQGWQAKLGAEFMPAVPITDPLQLYHAVQVAFGNWKADRRNTVTFMDYFGGQEFGPGQLAAAPALGFCPYSTLGVYAMTLEKSSTLAQSGSPISAARDLNVVFGSNNLVAYTDPAWKNLMADVYVPHVALATVFLDSVLTRS